MPAQPAPGNRRLIFHIGPTKSGSSSIQALIWQNQGVLREVGWFVPGSDQSDHFRIGMDIRQRRPAPDHHLGDWNGTYDAALRDFDRSSCHTMLITDEVLALAPREVVSAALTKADGLTVEVVYCMRELSGLLVSQWQGRVRNGIAETLDDWLVGIRDHEPGNRFWTAHDAPAVLDRWTAAGADEVHLLTLPGSGAPSDALWRRFESAMGWSATTNRDGRAANEALGLVEIDLMRRIQQNYAGEKHYVRRPVLNALVFREVLIDRDNDVPILLPSGSEDWVRAENLRRMDFAASTAIRLHGDVTDLEISDRRFGESDWEGHESEQRDAAVAVIVHLTDEIIRLRTELGIANRRLGDHSGSSSLGEKPTASRGRPGTRRRPAWRSISWPARLPRPGWLRRPKWL